MKIKKEFLRIHRLPGTVGGAKLEPEQQLAERVQLVDAAVTNKMGESLGALPTEIIAEHSVGELASIERAKCFGCKHFRPKDWHLLSQKMASNIEGRRELNRMRAALLTTENAKIHDAHGDEDGTNLEHALSVLGICGPLTEIDGEPIIVHPLGGCPAEVCSTARPTGLFEAKDQESDRHGTGAYDRIMRTAQGRHVPNP